VPAVAETRRDDRHQAFAPLRIIVNGREHEIAAAAGRTLLDVLRTDLGRTGAKPGCGEGACGACTVLEGSRAVHAADPGRPGAGLAAMTGEGA